MSSRYRRLIPAFRVFLLVALLAAGALSFQAYVTHSGTPALPATPDGELGKLDMLIDLYKNGRISVIDISSITDFSWDRLYIFEPYTSPTWLDAALGSSWRTNCSTRIEYSDGVTLLLFMKNGKVMHCADYPRSTDFQVPWPPPEGGYSPRQARFVLDDKGRLVLEGTK